MLNSRSPQVVLAVFDETAGMLLATELRKLGYLCRFVATAQECEQLMYARGADLIVAELGHEFLPIELITKYTRSAPVLGVAVPDAELFFRAAKAGVEAMLALPLDSKEYRQKLAEYCTRLRRSHEAGSGDRSPISLVSPPNGKALHTLIPSLFAASDEMAEVRETIAKVAPTNATVLVRGESGVGKELAARLIHSRSSRADRAFIKVNCAAIPNELLESELFGYDAGAFTGALRGKPGKFELADGGTIFLDEIGEMHPMLQAKLLHVLQDGDFARLGSKRDISVDVRIICATNQQLELLVESGKFREDLFYRVNVVTIHVPALRERRGEIPVLLDYFIERYTQQYGKTAPTFDQNAVAFLSSYDWPGNIRELENFCKRYVIVGGAQKMFLEMAHRSEARAGHLKDSVSASLPQESGGGDTESLAVMRAEKATNGGPGGNKPARRSTADLDRQPSLLEIGKQAAWAAERAAIEAMLAETHWNRREAAKRLHVSYKALLNKIQVMSLEAGLNGMALKH